MIRVFHFQSACIGCNACVEADMNRWRMSHRNGKSVLLGSKSVNGIYRIEVGNDEWDNIVKAVTNCPVKVIKAELI